MTDAITKYVPLTDIIDLTNNNDKLKTFHEQLVSERSESATPVDYDQETNKYAIIGDNNHWYRAAKKAGREDLLITIPMDSDSLLARLDSVGVVEQAMILDKVFGGRMSLTVVSDRTGKPWRWVKARKQLVKQPAEVLEAAHRGLLDDSQILKIASFVSRPAKLRQLVRFVDPTAGA